MSTLTKHIALLLGVAALLVACERKPISDTCVCATTLSIPIDIDWETSGIELQNVTVLFYDSSDGTLLYEHKYEHNNNDIQSYAYLPEGSYTAVVFNELRDQIDYLSCVGYDNLYTLRFESSADDPARSRATTRSYVEQSGDLAVAMVEGIEVTEDMILEAAYAADDDTGSTKALSTATKATIVSLMGVTTVKKNSTISITAHIDNIYYARMPALVDLNNLADGYYVYGDVNSNVPSTIQFTMNNRTYDEGSMYNGSISTTISTFGTLVDRSSTSGHDESTPVTLDFLFQLIDADYTEVSYEEDVTDQISFDETNNAIYLSINFNLSEPLPEVEPENSGGGSGFGAEVEDWDEVDVPLIQ